jgi:hypothetical protein
LCKKKTEIKLITADEIAKCKAEEKCNTTMASKKKNVALREYLFLNIKRLHQRHFIESFKLIYCFTLTLHSKSISDT